MTIFQLVSCVVCSSLCLSSVLAVGDDEYFDEELARFAREEHGSGDMASGVEAVDGGWSEWSNWGSCDVTCGGGLQARTRTCSNPEPTGGGVECAGNESETRTCNDQSFPNLTYCNGNLDEVMARMSADWDVYLQGMVKSLSTGCNIDGKWSQWTIWSECSVTCGGGVKVKHRTCTNPEPSEEGEPCTGNAQKTKTCNTNACSGVNGKFTQWSSWGACSATCGNGRKERKRTCTNPPPSNGGKNCKGRKKNRAPCNMGSCTAWGEWTNWGACSVTCFLGKATRTRECLRTGECQGNSTEEKDCFGGACPVNGGFSTWSSWTDCSATCDDGTRTRTRTCSRPYPHLGGKPCEGPDSETETCETAVPCVVDGNWCVWGSWSQCTVTCGSGRVVKQRRCDDPPPSEGGKPCTGLRVAWKVCSVSTPCPVNGGFSAWNNWSDCSVTCDFGMKTRTRQCNNPRPAFGGDNCTYSYSEEKKCYGGSQCPEDPQGLLAEGSEGQWSIWSSWTDCHDSVACGLGWRVRTRTCTGGETCPGGQFLESICCALDIPCPLTRACLPENAGMLKNTARRKRSIASVESAVLVL